MLERQMRCVELSALRYDELGPLVDDLDNVQLQNFRYISFHAPSSFTPDHEEQVIAVLNKVLTRGWNVIVHPDVIYSPNRWEHFGHQLLVENMDRRKPTGRSVAELQKIRSAIAACAFMFRFGARQTIGHHSDFIVEPHLAFQEPNRRNSPKRP
jgi:hypothetical protein